MPAAAPGQPLPLLLSLPSAAVLDAGRAPAHNVWTKGHPMMSRRNTLLGLGVFSAALAGARGLLAGAPAHAARSFELTRSDAQWQSQLTPAQYRVLRQAGTERPHSSPLNAEKRTGTYTCAGCALPLFASATKFESGTGWPSFWKVLDKAVIEESDTSLFMKRTEVLCHRCGGHLGHVFDDGPPPTRLRYCMNGVAMNFLPQ